MEALLKRLWPILRVLVAARLATWLIAVAKRAGQTLTQEEAVEIAALIIAELTDLLDGTTTVDPALVTKAKAIFG